MRGQQIITKGWGFVRGVTETAKKPVFDRLFTCSRANCNFKLRITKSEEVFQVFSHFSRMFFVSSHFSRMAVWRDDEKRRCARSSSPGVASLLGELAGTSSTDSLTARRERRSGEDASWRMMVSRTLSTREVASLLGELAGASSTDSLTARRAGGI